MISSNKDDQKPLSPRMKPHREIVIPEVVISTKPSSTLVGKCFFSINRRSYNFSTRLIWWHFHWFLWIFIPFHLLIFFFNLPVFIKFSVSRKNQPVRMHRWMDQAQVPAAKNNRKNFSCTSPSRPSTRTSSTASFCSSFWFFSSSRQSQRLSMDKYSSSRMGIVQVHRPQSHWYFSTRVH